MIARIAKSKLAAGAVTAVLLGFYFWDCWQDYRFVTKPVTPMQELAHLPAGTLVRVQGRVRGASQYATLVGLHSCAVAQSEVFVRRMRERNRVEVKYSASLPSDGFSLVGETGVSVRVKMSHDPHTVWMTRGAAEIDDFQPEGLTPDQRRLLGFESTEGQDSVAQLGLYYLIEHCLNEGDPLTIDARVEQAGGEPVLVNGPRGQSVVTDLSPDEVLPTVQRYEGRVIPVFARWCLNLLIFLAAVAVVVAIGRKIRPGRQTK